MLDGFVVPPEPQNPGLWVRGASVLVCCRECGRHEYVVAQDFECMSYLIADNNHVKE